MLCMIEIPNTRRLEILAPLLWKAAHPLGTIRPERLVFAQRVVAVRAFRASHCQLENSSISSWRPLSKATKGELKRRSSVVGVNTTQIILSCGAYSSIIQ